MEKVRFDELPIGIQKEALRAKRKPLLEAFDKYKSNLTYLGYIESQDTHDTIVAWYQNILGLNAEAIDNPPKEITQYIK